MPTAVETPGKTPMKRPYRKPELITYGDIREITQTLASSMGNPDGLTIFLTKRRTGGGL